MSVSEPDLDKPVFTRFRAAEGRIELAEYVDPHRRLFNSFSDINAYSNSTVELSRGATLLVPFRAVEQHVLRGEAELV